jgi:PKD repeat protein
MSPQRLPGLAALRILARLAACVCTAGPAGAVSLIRFPYIQSCTPTSAIVVWKLSPATGATLEYGPSLAYGLQAASAADTLHAIPLTGLAPATRYFYRITAGGQQLAGGEDYWFETAPVSGGVRVLLFGDSGTGTQTQWAMGRLMGTLPVDLALHMGDVVYSAGEVKYYESRFFRPYAEWLRHTPIYPTLGNHDLATASGAPYLANFYLPTGSLDGTERNYSFDYGDAHFACVNANSLSSAVATWLAADLAASTKRWKIAYWHESPYSCGYHGNNSTVQTYLVPVIEQQHVDLVFTGHDHDYQRLWPVLQKQALHPASDPDYVNPGAPIYIVTGGGAGVRPTSDTCWFSHVAISRTHACRMQIAGDLLHLEAIDSTGTCFDRMTIRKTSTPAESFVRLLAGNGRERWRAGRTYAITWHSSDVGTSVNLEVSRNGGATFETIEAGVPNSGSYSWRAKGPGAGDCRLRLSAARSDNGAPVSDTSDAPIRLEPEETLPAEGGLVRAFNFQEVTQTPPVGYVADTGALYTPERGYGWTTCVAMRTRGKQADPRLDSFAGIANTTTAEWGCDLPDGSYRVTLVLGDPTQACTHRVLLNGKTVLEAAATGINQFLTVRDFGVVVGGGRLGMTLGGSGGAYKTAVCYLEVRRCSVLPPWAAAQASPRSGEVPLAVSFTGTAAAARGSVTSTIWSFGDGQGASTATAQHTYTGTGAYWARFNVTDDSGLSSSDSVRVTVVPAAPPRIVLSAPTTAGYAPLAVSFRAQVTDASPLASQTWSFGDGSTASGAATSHTYAALGSYVACFTATDALGLTARDSLAISVRDPATDRTTPRLATRSPADGATGISSSTGIVLSLCDAETGIASPSVSLSVNGAAVLLSFTGRPDSLVVVYRPSTPFVSGSTVTVALSASDRAAPPNTATWNWSFGVAGTGATPLTGINFQPSTFTTPAGYTPDTGALYSVTLGRGWDKKVSAEYKIANADPRLNSYVYITNTSSATWSLDIANGNYLVTVVAGSPTFTGQHRVEVEGVVAIDNLATGANVFVTASDVPVTVGDGKLSVRIGGIAGNTKKTKLCFLDIRTDAASRSGFTKPLPGGPVALLGPNPAFGSAVLYLRAPAAARARVQVFDVRGRLVRLLLDGPAPAGVTPLFWDGRDDQGAQLPSGIYLVHTAVPSQRHVFKLALVR